MMSCLNYQKRSPLIPVELQLKIDNNMNNITPYCMSYFLRFLCYNQLGDISNREKALSDLDLIVENRYLIPLKDIFDAMEILALCYEISGDKNKANEIYFTLRPGNGIFMFKISGKVKPNISA